MLKDIIVSRRPLGANFTESNHLGLAYMKEPQKLDNLVDTLFATRLYNTTPLIALFGGNRITVDENIYEWPLSDVPARPPVVIEQITTGNVVGQYHQPIELVLDNNHLKKGEYVAPNGNTDKQLRVIDGPTPWGTGYKYTFEIALDDDLATIEQKYIKVGSKMKILFAKYGEMSTHAGGVSFGSNLKMHNKLSEHRYKYGVSGDIVENDALAITIVDENGQKYTSWIRYAEAKFWNKTKMAEEKDYWFSRSTNTILDENGRPVRSGAGLHEQIEEGGWVAPFTNLTASLIEEFVMDIFFGRSTPSGGRRIVAFTGEYGMRAFHNAMVDWLKVQPQALIYDGFVLRPMNSPYHANAAQAGYRILSYILPNGAEIQLVHNPMYDDPDGEIDPITGANINSMRMTFVDVTDGEGGNNIVLVEKRNSKRFSYVNGLVGPTGPVNISSHTGDWYEMITQFKAGIILRDPTRSGMLIFNA